MRNRFAIAVCAVLVFSTAAFGEKNAKFSPALQVALKYHVDETSSLSQGFSIFSHPVTGETTYGVFVKVHEASDASRLIEAGAEVHTILPSGCVTAWLPARSLDAICSMDEVEYVELASKCHPFMDVSRPEIGIDDVHSGWNLPKAYKGKGVIIGVVDTGIDWNHPDFQNPDGTTRILFIWDQCATSGTPPAGYSYGNECDSGEINSQTCSEADDNPGGGGHGTHVAGTAAGNGLAENGYADYTGIAPEADIIFVNSLCAGNPGGFEDAVVDAASYIFAKADALGKPAVINMSLGHHMGPHDGTHPFESMLTELTGPGKIIVAAVGNEAQEFLHLGYEVDSNQRASLFIPSQETTQIVFDVWYAPEHQISVYLGIISPFTWELLEYTEWIEPGGYSTGTFWWTGHQYYIESEASSPINGDRHVLMLIAGEGLDQYYWQVGFISDQTATFDCWAQRYQGSFLTDPYSYWTPGDNLRCAGIPSSAKKVISVAAYNTKNQWLDSYGLSQGDWNVSIDDIADFSNFGPSRDGRQKPEIAAPGQFIVSALTDDIALGPDGIPPEYVVWGGYYQKMQGTSQACPHITGVVALMLQKNPNVDYNQVINVLSSSARRDPYTGAVPNMRWGHGKIDGYAAVEATPPGDAIDRDDVFISTPQDYGLLQNYPNPFNPTTSIQYAVSSGQAPPHVTLKIYNILGQDVRVLVDEPKEAGHYTVSWDGCDESGHDVASGVYFYRLTAGGFTATKRMMFLK